MAGIATFLQWLTLLSPPLFPTEGTGMGFGAVPWQQSPQLSHTDYGSVLIIVALAPGMGLNAFFTFGVIFGMGYTFQQALAAVFVAGIVFIGLSVTPARKYIINSIPKSMKLGVGAGIGLFLAIIGLKNAGVVVDNPATLVGLGDVASWPVLLTGLGFVIMAMLDKRKVPGAIIIGILAVSIIAWIFGIADLNGFAGAIPSPEHAFSLDFSMIATAGFIGTAFAFLFVDFFDTAGTLTSVANLTGKVDKKTGEVAGIDRALLADSVATSAGALVGTSNTTSYIESGAGIKEGGKTGLTAVVVAILFGACLFFAPLAQSIPAFATAPALIFIATYFLRNIADIDWDDVTEYAPAVLAAVLMPLTFSIAHGIALGFIAYAVIKALSGKFDELNAGSIAIAAVSVVYFVAV